MQTPSPQTIRGKLTYYFLKNLPGFLFILILLAVTLVTGGIIKDKRAQLAQEIEAAIADEATAINVITLNLTPTILQDTINLTGRIEPWTRLELMARVSGKIEEVFIQKGDMVKKGQVLAHIEPDDYRITLDSARAAYDLARVSFIRDKTMHSKGIVPQSTLDTRLAARTTARAAMEKAELNLSRTRITAPMAGIISRLDANIGLFLNIADPVAEILEIDRVKAVVGIPESDVIAVKKLKEVEVTIPAMDNKTITAPVHLLTSFPQSLAQVYRLELSLANPDQQILTGMFIQANIIKTIDEEAIAVPLYSVISKDNNHFVYVEENGKAIKRQVKLGFLDGWQVLIISGLKSGENVIIKGHRNVEDGQNVNVIKSVKTLTELIP